MFLKKILRDIKFKWQLRKTDRRDYSLSDIFNAPDKIVLLYPSQPNEQKSADNFIKELTELFDQARFTLVGNRDAGVKRVDYLKKATKLEPSYTEMLWSGLPGRQFVDKVVKEDADVLIELAVRKDYFNAYVAACSKVPVRIGNYGSWGSPIYNLEIKSNYIQNEKLILRSIMDVLKSLKAGINN